MAVPKSLVLSFTRTTSTGYSYRSDFALSGEWGNSTYDAQSLQVNDNPSTPIHIQIQTMLVLHMTVTDGTTTFSFSTLQMEQRSTRHLRTNITTSLSREQCVDRARRYIQYPTFSFSDVSSDTFSVVCATPDIIQHVELVHDDIRGWPETTHNISHIEETGFAGSQVTVSLHNGDRNIKELWDAWGNTYKTSTVENNSVAIEFDLAGSEVVVWQCYQP